MPSVAYHPLVPVQSLICLPVQFLICLPVQFLICLPVARTTYISQSERWSPRPS